MTTRKLDKSQWRSFLDLLSREIEGKRVEIKVAALNLGVQTEAEWLPLIGLVYDPKDDLVEVALQGVDHLIRKPREIYVVEQDGEFSSLEIVDAAGNKQIVRLKDPLMLPPG